MLRSWYASWQLLAKFRTHLLFSKILYLPCTGDAKPESRPGVVILSTFCDVDLCLYFCSCFFVFCCIKNNKHVLSSCSCVSFIVFCVVTTTWGKRFRPCVIFHRLGVLYLFWNFVTVVLKQHAYIYIYKYVYIKIITTKCFKRNQFHRWKSKVTTLSPK